MELQTDPVNENLYPGLNKLADMLVAGRGVAWITFGPAHVYLRVGKKMIEGKLRLCVQIANITMPVADRRKGVFTSLVQRIEEMTDLPIYIEQLLNRQFMMKLLTKGYRPARKGADIIWDLVKTKDKPNDMTLIGETKSGHSIWRQENGAGGHRYISDSIGGGVIIWDTCLSSVEELEFCMDYERKVKVKDGG